MRLTEPEDDACCENETVMETLSETDSVGETVIERSTDSVNVTVSDLLTDRSDVALTVTDALTLTSTDKLNVVETVSDVTMVTEPDGEPVKLYDGDRDNVADKLLDGDPLTLCVALIERLAFALIEELGVKLGVMDQVALLLTLQDTLCVWLDVVDTL